MRAQKGAVSRARIAAAVTLGAAAWTANVAPAAADEPGPDTLPITVVAIQTSDADDQAEALTKALRNAVRAMPGWSLGEGDYSLEVLTLSLKCSEPPDASCESRIADQIKADRYMWGMIEKEKDGANVSGELHLWVRGKGTSKVPLRYSVNLTEPADDSLRRVASDSLNSLTGGPPKGGVHVKAGKVPGQVFIDTKPVGALASGEGTFALPAGPHRIVVKAPGFLDVESPVMIRPNVTADVVLSPQPAEAPSTVNVRKIGGFVSVGLGVGLAAVGVVSSLQVNGVQNDEGFQNYRKAWGSLSSDVCADAKANKPLPAGRDVGNVPRADEIVTLCDKAATFELLQPIFYGAGALAGGLGIYLIATSTSSTPSTTTGWTVVPQIGNGAGKVDVAMRW